MGNFERLDLVKLLLNLNYEVDEAVIAVQTIERELYDLHEEDPVSDVPF